MYLASHKHIIPYPVDRYTFRNSTRVKPQNEMRIRSNGNVQLSIYSLGQSVRQSVSQSGRLVLLTVQLASCWTLLLNHNGKAMKISRKTSANCNFQIDFCLDQPDSNPPPPPTLTRPHRIRCAGPRILSGSRYGRITFLILLLAHRPTAPAGR